MNAAGNGNRFVSLIGLFGLELLLCSLAASGFGMLAFSHSEPWLHEQDVAVLHAVRESSSPLLDPLAVLLSWFGGPQGITGIGLIALLLGLLRRQWVESATLVSAVLGGVVLSMVLKPYFERPRPDLFEPIVIETGFSFPSSHALVGFCLYGGLAALLVLGSPRDLWRWVSAAVLVVLAIGIAWSRLYLGVHWLTDVVAGTLVALFWLTVCLGTARAFRRLPASRTDERAAG